MDFKSTEKIAIIDANNFYVSCERTFQPELIGKPTAVLSNNDGCFIARSNEVKEMGIKMGQPKFLLDDKVQSDIKMFSSNFSLYGDMSDRVVNILKRMVPRLEVYSIDELFLDLSHIPEMDMEKELFRIKSDLNRLTGIPFSIGVGPTKTLAKLCNHLSKTNPTLDGVCSYWSINKDSIVDLPIEEVWGIGRGFKKRLSELDVKTVGDFIKVPHTQVRKLLGVVGQRTWFELNEVICHPISEKFPEVKGITSSRSFGSSQWNPEQVKNAFWNQLTNCHRKLIKEEMEVLKINLFATGNHFSDNLTLWEKSLTLSKQTDDLDAIWNQISPHLDDLPIRLWQKCGVIFSTLRKRGVEQLRLFDVVWEEKKKPIVDEQMWMTRRDFLTPEWTTKWTDIQEVF